MRSLFPRVQMISSHQTDFFCTEFPITENKYENWLTDRVL